MRKELLKLNGHLRKVSDSLQRITDELTPLPFRMGAAHSSKEEKLLEDVRVGLWEIWNIQNVMPEGDCFKIVTRLLDLTSDYNSR